MEFLQEQRNGDRAITTQLATLWIAISAWACVSGWLLSSAGQLNRTGYALALALLVFLLWRIPSTRSAFRGLCEIRRGRLTRRFTKVFRTRRTTDAMPALFALLALLAFLGGALYHANNSDFLTYRFPRLLHWWGEGQWHWVCTDNPRTNFSGCTSEWTIMPLFQLTRSDRLFFLTNWIPFLLLPGLVYSVFLRLGAGRRTAWWWMWMLPSGYCYLMQAGSVCNDSLGAFFLLSSLHFGLKAMAGGGFSCFGLALVSAGLLTGVKASNLPLLLPCLIPLAAQWRLILRRPVTFTAISVSALLVSFLPVAVLNHLHTGKWTGDPLNECGVNLSSPLAGLVGNSIQFAVGIIEMPVMPLAGKINSQLHSLQMSDSLAWLRGAFPRLLLQTGEIPREEFAGPGAMLVLVSGMGLFVSLLNRRHSFGRPPLVPRNPASWRWMREAILIAGLLAAAVYAAKAGSENTARLMAPYYPLLLVASLRICALVRGDSEALPLSHQGSLMRWWKRLALLAMALAAVPLTLTQARPLWPTVATLDFLAAKMPGKALLERSRNVYETYSRRWDMLAPVREALPPMTTKVGFLTSVDDSEVSLWRPFGLRRVISLKKGQTSSEWPEVFVARVDMLQGTPWLQERGYMLHREVTVTSKVQEGPVDWVILTKPKR